MALPLRNQPFLYTQDELERYAPGSSARIDPYFAGGPQSTPNPYSNQLSGATTFALGAGALGAGGYALHRAGYNVINPLYSAVRYAEEFSPGQVLRTFQAGNFLSQFTTAGRQPFEITANVIERMARENNVWFSDLMYRTQGAAIRGVTEGLQFRGGVLSAGDTILFQNARMMRSIGTPYLAAAASRASGFTGLSNVTDPRKLRIPVEGMDEFVYFTEKGAGKQAHMLATEWIERANRLAHEPFEMEPFRTVLSKARHFTRNQLGPLSFDLDFSVKSGAALPTLGRMTAKWGLVSLGAYLGYQTADWAVRNTGFLDNTIFGEGITAGIATVGVKANLLAASIADAIPGAREYREAQEEAAPGSTSLLKLAGFPIAGALAGATMSYVYGGARRLSISQKLISEGTERTAALASAHRIFAETEKEFTKTNFITNFARKKFGKEALPFIGPASRAKVWALGGVAIGLAMVAPFTPGALVPDHTEEELEAIYSGQEEVAVRKGRWWELGRCLIKSNTYTLFDGSTKTSDEISIGDVLVGRNNRPATVKNIFTRHHQGEVYIFSTAFDRTIVTGITGNHIIPVLRNGHVCEVPAEEIKVNEWVEVPFANHDSSLTKIRCGEIIKKPFIVQNKRLFATQINWYTRQLQKSGTTSIPTELELDYDLGKLFGLFLAKGNLSFKNGSPTIVETVHAKNETQYVDEIIRISKEKFGITPTVRFKRTGTLAKEGCWIVRICSAIVAQLYRFLFYPNKYSAEQKAIPPLFLDATKTFKQGLIDGYWMGDGHLDGPTKVISSARKDLLVSIQKCALDLGVVSGISFETNDFKGKYRLRFYKENSSNSGCKLIEGRLFTRIRQITLEEYNDTVYDFEVDDKDHLLCAGVFLVHNSPYEGGRIDYYRPHWYPRMLQRGRDKSLYGEEDPSPIGRWIKEEFTYDFEREHYYDRPYPITGTFGEDIPILGPLIAATIGQLIKPPKLMHVEEWQRNGASDASLDARTEVLRIQDRYGTPPGPQEVNPGTPVNPYSFTQSVGEQAYRLTELSGLVGFTATAIQEAITGSNELFDQEERLQSARRAYGCLDSDTQIRTKNNKIKLVKEIIPGDTILTHSGKFAEVKDLVCKPKEIVPGLGKLLSISCFGHANTLNLTPDHLVFTDKGWKEAKMIREGDYIGAPIRKIESKDKQIHLSSFLNYSSTDNWVYPKASYKYIKAYEDFENKAGMEWKSLYTNDLRQRVKKAIKKQNVYRVPNSIKTTYEFGIFLGLFLSEGNIIYQSSGKPSGIKLTLHKKERFFIKWFEDTISPFIKSISCSVSTSRPNTLNCCIYGTVFAEFILALVGEKENKHIPDFFWNYGKEFCLGLVKGLIEGDGYIDHQGRRVSFSNKLARKQIVYALKELVISLGFGVGAIKEKPPSLNPERPDSGKAEIRFNGNAADKLAFAIGHKLRPPQKRCSRKNYFFTDSHVFCKIKKVKSAFANYVYDIVLDHPDHSFLTECGIVHNSERAYWDLSLGGAAGTSEFFRRLYPHRRRQIPEYNPIRNTMPCLLPETEVLLKNGLLKPAKDIKVGDQVISHTGEDAVIEAIDTHPAHEIIHIKLYGDNLHVLDFSWNHPLFTNNKEFVNAADIKAGDYVAFPRRKYQSKKEDKNIDLAKFIKDGEYSDEYIYYGIQKNNWKAFELAEKHNFEINSIDSNLKRKYKSQIYNICKYHKNSTRPKSLKRIKRFWKSSDFYYLLGVYAAEGSAGNKKKSLKLSGHLNDKWEERIKEICLNYDLKVSLQAAKIGTGQNTIITNPVLLEICQRLCPGHARNKFLSHEVIDHQNSILDISQLLKGLIDGDGYFIKTSEGRIKCGLRTTSKDLAYQFRNLVIDTLGIAPAITKHHKPYFNIHVTCSGEAANKLAKFIDYPIIPYQPKQDNSKQYSDGEYIYIKVKKVISELKECTVYAHQVSGDHTYCVSLIATHNTWLPGPGEKSPDFLHGDPFTKVAEGEIRLPGAGYASRFPELEGVAPEDYPIVHQYKILSDIAPYADRTKEAEIQVRAAISRGDLSREEIDLFDKTRRQLREKKKSRTNFVENQVFIETPTAAVPGSSQSSQVLALVNEQLKAKGEAKRAERGLFGNLFGGMWETAVGAAQNPFEALTPLAPVSKLVATESALENYKRTRAYGPQIAFWESPLENFILPFFRETADVFFGTQPVPEDVQKQRELAQYFDLLEYIKNSRLADASRDTGAWQTAKAYDQAAEETLFGVNPYARGGNAFTSIFRALPRSERDYFTAFSKASGAEERQAILDLIPENERKIYRAQWELQYADQIRDMLNEGQIPEENVAAAEAEMQAIYNKRQTEGLPQNEDLLERFAREKEPGESYGDWYRRAILIPQLEEQGKIPGPDWVGWHPGTDLDLIKLKVVQNEGMDIHDFNLWESDRRRAAHLDLENKEEALEPIVLETDEPTKLEAKLREILNELDIRGQVALYALEADNDSTHIVVDATEVRDADLAEALQERLDTLG